MNFRVRLTIEARSQLNLISRYIGEHSPENARRWRRNIRECLRSLSRSPNRHEIAYRAADIGHDVRHTFFGVYRILYTIIDDSVIIVSIRHGARQPPTLDEMRRID